MTSPRLVDRLEERVEEVLAAHGDSRSVADFGRYRGRVSDFARDELGFTPYGKQEEMFASFLANRRTVVPGFHGAGKDAALAVIALYAALVARMLVLVISATERQLLGQTWRELAARFSSRLPGTLYTADFRLGGEKRIVAMTSGNTSNLTGWHDVHGVCILISESQAEQVGEAAFDAAIANAVDDKSRIVVAGNPVHAAGRFYEVSRKPTWHTIQISAFDHPNVREGRVVIPGGPAPGWPAEMEREFGADSAFYVARVLGQFPVGGAIDALVRPEWLEGAYARHAAGVAMQRDPVPVVALDVARSLDRDESVCALVQGPRVLGLEAWRSRDLVATAGRFLAIGDRARLAWYAACRNRTIAPEATLPDDPDALAGWLAGMGVRPFPLVIDAPGVGSGVVDDCRRRGRDVVEYWGWNPPHDPRRFANVRAEAYWNVRTLLQAGTAVVPRDPAMHEELLAIEWSQDAKGRIAILPKDELRAQLGGRSPDRLDSCVIGLYVATGGMQPPTVSFTDYAGVPFAAE